VFAWHPMPWALADVPPVSWLLDAVAPNSVVYDIGANRGYVALALLAKVPGLRVVAWEPNPDVFAKLSANLDLNDFAARTDVQNSGLGERPGRRTLYVAAADTASSLDQRRAAFWGRGLRAACEVEINTLDAVVASSCLPPPTHIKIDTEGFEAQILLGAQETLRRYRPELFLEVHADAQGDGDNFAAIIAALSNHVYRVMRHANQLYAVPTAS
jgi:FkbM family methyltransferase